jgi:hypothetical protein
LGMLDSDHHGTNWLLLTRYDRQES